MIKQLVLGFFSPHLSHFPPLQPPFPSFYSIKKAQNHWLEPRFFERVFNVRPRVISVTVSNYDIKVIKSSIKWYFLIKNLML
jgi:hypothetical protein